MALGKLEAMPLVLEVGTLRLEAEELATLLGRLWVMMAAGNQFDVEALEAVGDTEEAGGTTLLVGTDEALTLE